MKRIIFLILSVFLVGAPHALAQAPRTAPPFEIVKNDVDLEAAPDGRFWEVDERRYRALSIQGVQALQQVTLSYTAGYQTLQVIAYTLKKDGTRIDIPEGSMLKGRGASTQPGFSDDQTLSLVYPNLEVGDQTVLISKSQQIVPLFPNVFANSIAFSRDVAVGEASFAFTTQGDDAAFHIVASGVEARPSVTLNGKTRRVWRYSNATPVQPETGAVSEIEDFPRVEITTLSDYAGVAKLYADIFRDKARVTPEISAQASKIVSGIKDRRAQAMALYDWVSAHIRYVNIVLGAGGFVPHEAGDILKNGYGDCKDHVMLLEALLAARGIKSSAVLIRAGADQFKLPQAPSPFLFDHLITYLPEFQLFADSTAHYAPFGVLPASDAGKAVLIVEGGKTAVTPPASIRENSVTANSTLTVNADGSADGDARIHVTGADAVSARALMAALPPDGDSNYFRALLGPGSDGKFQRGDPEKLAPEFDFSAHYHVGHLVNIPGPGALPAGLGGFKGFSFSALIGLDLPPGRSRDYVCAAGRYQASNDLVLPAGVTVTALPPVQAIATAGAELHIEYQQPSPQSVHVASSLKLDRPGPVCRAADYDKVRPDLSRMINALSAQILYK